MHKNYKQNKKTVKNQGTIVRQFLALVGSNHVWKHSQRPFHPFRTRSQSTVTNACHHSGAHKRLGYRGEWVNCAPSASMSHGRPGCIRWNPLPSQRSELCISPCCLHLHCERCSPVLNLGYPVHQMISQCSILGTLGRKTTEMAYKWASKALWLGRCACKFWYFIYLAFCRALVLNLEDKMLWCLAAW